MTTTTPVMPDPFAPSVGDRWIGSALVVTVLSIDDRGEGHASIQLRTRRESGELSEAVHQMSIFDLVSSLVDSVEKGFLWTPRGPWFA